MTETQSTSFQTTDDQALYYRVGGLEGVKFLAQTLVKRAILNPTIGHIWKHKTQAEIQGEIAGFVEFLGMHWGGPHTYEGPDMATSHRGMGITEDYWDALFNDLVTPAFEEFDIPQREAVEIDAFLRSFKSVIVGSPTYREVIVANPDMDIMDGMQSVGIVWPKPASK